MYSWQHKSAETDCLKKYADLKYPKPLLYNGLPKSSLVLIIKKGFYNKQITRNHLKNTGGVKPASAARWKFKIQKISVIKF